jgi:hypothetical protein
MIEVEAISVQFGRQSSSLFNRCRSNGTTSFAIAILLHGLDHAFGK